MDPTLDPTTTDPNAATAGANAGVPAGTGVSADPAPSSAPADGSGIASGAGAGSGAGNGAGAGAGNGAGSGAMPTIDLGHDGSLLNAATIDLANGQQDTDPGYLAGLQSVASDILAIQNGGVNVQAGGQAFVPTATDMSVLQTMGSTLQTMQAAVTGHVAGEAGVLSQGTDAIYNAVAGDLHLSQALGLVNPTSADNGASFTSDISNLVHGLQAGNGVQIAAAETGLSHSAGNFGAIVSEVVHDYGHGVLDGHMADLASSMHTLWTSHG